MKHYLATLITVLLLLFTASAAALPAEQMVRALNNSVLRVHVNLPSGKVGLGSAVVIAKNEVITNCHVVNDATDINVIINGEPHPATAIKTDWKHDLCMLTVKDLALPAVEFGASKTLQYDTLIFTVGYPDETKAPVNTYGAVEGLFPMDDSVIIRATSSFKPGASGGGAFDEAGKLIGIITLKSRGDSAFYYYMPVEWVQALMDKPAQKLGVQSEKPFWANNGAARPYFMQVVTPYVSKQWKNLISIATEWADREPNTAESWFYLATAEFATQDYVKAEAHFRKVIALNGQHNQALAYLKKLTALKGQSNKLTDKVAMANSQY